MICFIGLVIMFFTVVFGKFLDLSLIVALGALGVGVTLSVFLFPQKPSFKEPEFLCKYELLPVASNAYLIKTCNNKIVCRYINENNEEKVDTIDSCWKEINEVEIVEKASIKYYERKPKLSLTVLPFTESRIEVVVTIPKGTIVY